MGALDGRVAIITGAGRGLGREHALLFASEGAKVVVNDLGGDMHGEGGDPSRRSRRRRHQAMGGEAVVNGDNVADWDGAQRLVEQAVDTFGDLHVLVNNAGILRDRVIINMTEDEWDAVIDVHLKGHFAPTHLAAAYWREQTKAGNEVNASIVHTSSTSGLFSNPGQANYDAAKSGIATLSQIWRRSCALRRALERDRARRADPPHRGRRRASAMIGKPADEGVRRVGPGQRLAVRRVPRTADCPFTGETFLVQGGHVQRVQTWTLAEKIDKDDRWTVAELARRAGELTSRIPLEEGGMGAPQYRFD